MSESSTGLMPALLAVQKEAPKLLKSSEAKAGSFSYTYADLATVMEAIGPLLTEHGLVWSTFPTIDEQGRPALRYRITHAETGESEQDTMSLMLAKSDAQAQGSAITYARRYSITAVLNLISDDDDGRAASTPPGPKTATPEDVQEMQAAAGGLETNEILKAIESCGVEATAWNKIPAAKVAAVAKALAGAERQA